MSFPSGATPPQADTNVVALITRALRSAQAGDLASATALAGEAARLDPMQVQSWFILGRVDALSGRSASAVTNFSRALQLQPGLAAAVHARAVELFRLGRIDASVTDFDRVAELAPENAPQDWQRGIALFYAGRFEDGRRQFELHRTVNPNDVENAAWHFLCVARIGGVEAARASILKVQGDSRVPMRELYELYAGGGSSAKVMAAAQAGEATAAERRRRLFYAHLYLGLHAEAAGDTTAAREHLRRAAGEFRVDDFMGDVAAYHVSRPASSAVNSPKPSP